MRRISQKSDEIWSFRCYGPGDSIGGFDAWHNQASVQFKAHFAIVIQILLHQRDWGEPHYKDLTGRCAGLGEIIITVKVSKRVGKKNEIVTEHYRVLGFADYKKVFVLLDGFQKISGDEYRIACPRALKRKEGVLKDGSRAQYCQFP